MNRTHFVLSAFAASLFAAATTHGQGFNVDFGDDFQGLPSTYGAASGQTGAWNDVFSSGTLDGLDGAPTSVFLSLAAGSTSGNIGTPTTDNETLLNDNFFSSSGWSINLFGLTDGVYDLYFYAPTNGAVVSGDISNNETGDVFIEIPGGDGTTLVEGESFGVVSGITIDGGLFILSAVDPFGGPSNVGLAGLQIVPAVPEPSAALLASLGLVAAATRRRR